MKLISSNKKSTLSKVFLKALGFFLITGNFLGLTLSYSAPRPKASSQYIYTDSLSQVNSRRAKELTFDKDLRTLSRLEGRFQERLPRLIPSSKTSRQKAIQKRKASEAQKRKSPRKNVARN